MVRLLLLQGSDKQLKVEGSKEDEEISVYGFTPSTTLLLKSAVCLPVDLVGRERRMRLLYEAI